MLTNKATKRPKLEPVTSLRKLAAHPLLDELPGAALVVYLRIVAASSGNGRRGINVRNRDLHKDERTAQAVVQRLVRAGLVAIRYHHDQKKAVTYRILDLL